jgi:hypothetical protein
MGINGGHVRAGRFHAMTSRLALGGPAPLPIRVGAERWKPSKKAKAKANKRRPKG